MRIKKSIIAFTVVVAMGVMGVSALADNTATTTSASGTSSSENFAGKIFKNKTPLTQEQKDAMKAEREAEQAKIKATQDKWAALTDAQKEEIYSLKDQQANIGGQIVDKYAEFGVIDATTAADMKARITERKTNMRTEGKMPMGGGHFGKGDKDGRDCKGGKMGKVVDPAATVPSSATTTPTTPATAQ